MGRPRKSTLDALLDTFADWCAEDQEAALDSLAMIHRQTKRRESRSGKPEAEQNETQEAA
jgi:hypothetical protein